MKQKYSKPMVYIERFELLDHISRGCNYAGAVVNQQKPESCSYAVDNLALAQRWQILCIVKTEMSTLFNSVNAL